MVTSTVEDYLKVILLRSADSEQLVPMGEIASGLGVVPGTVTTMIKTLAEKGLIEHLPRHGVRLTAEGRKEATLVLRKHRLVETFLVSILRMDWSEVHGEAERLEHAVSDRVLEKIDALLQHPRSDPHGDPIPDAAGRFTSAVTDTLARVAIGQPSRIARILDQSPGFLQFVENQGLVPGQAVVVVERHELAGVVKVRIESGAESILGHTPAQLILVERAEVAAEFGSAGVGSEGSSATRVIV